jgi:hypothetical protein
MWRRELMERIEASPTWAVKQNPLRDLVLNQEEKRVKLNKGIVVKGKTMNGDELFMSMWDVKNIVQMKRMNRSGYNRITNVFNVRI